MKRCLSVAVHAHCSSLPGASASPISTGSVRSRDERSRIAVTFAPDWRGGVPYQQLLADALAECGVDVTFLPGYKRVLPLWRLMRRRPCDILHLHWPEAYYTSGHPPFDWFRRIRFPLDLAAATRRCAVVLTAHNLLPHDRGSDALIARNARIAFQRADAVIAHSEGARTELLRTYPLDGERIHVVPHGDLAAAMPDPPRREDARAVLHLDREKVCLMFGMVQPYKGIEEVIRTWREQKPAALLAIAGQPASAAYARAIEQAAAGANIRLDLRRLDDKELAHWLSAADCVLFNYRKVFTSGAAILARSWGVPILLPAHLEAVALDEPNMRVLRFTNLETALSALLSRAFALEPAFDAAAGWRASIAWPRIAEQTVAVYRKALRIRGRAGDQRN